MRSIQALNSLIAGLDDQAEAARAELRLARLDAMGTIRAPSYITVPVAPITDAQIDALEQQEMGA